MAVVIEMVLIVSGRRSRHQIYRPPPGHARPVLLSCRQARTTAAESCVHHPRDPAPARTVVRPGRRPRETASAAQAQHRGDSFPLPVKMKVRHSHTEVPASRISFQNLNSGACNRTCWGTVIYAPWRYNPSDGVNALEPAGRSSAIANATAIKPVPISPGRGMLRLMPQCDTAATVDQYTCHYCLPRASAGSSALQNAE